MKQTVLSSQKQIPMAACPNCDGHGTVQCSTCEGDGNYRTWNEDDERVIREEEPCDRCGGDGFVECGSCGGSGGYNRSQELGFDNDEQFRDNML